jgi:hypothetical protein
LGLGWGDGVVGAFCPSPTLPLVLVAFDEPNFELKLEIHDGLRPLSFFTLPTGDLILLFGSLEATGFVGVERTG